jgi:glycosyltransferase involved in cell wall biosynthesis
MKVLFYSPYIPDHFGGGEKHLFDIATTVATKHDVFIALPHSLFSHENDDFEFINNDLINSDDLIELKNNKIIKNIREKYEKFLNYSLKNIKFIPSLLKTGSVFDKLKETRNFDYLYYATDGSFFISAAKKNNLHIQIPFTNKLNILNKIKLNAWQIKNTNSEFTKQVVENSWLTSIDYVHNPLVSLEEIKLGKNKENIILNVGRFFKQLHSKRQDVLVNFFKKLVDENKSELIGWKLVLVGKVEDKEYLDEVIELAKGYPIEIKIDVSREDLINLYKKSKIYWHATGYGVDENINPEKVEHFGITTIEAMAAGCVPIVINKGGQKEILGDELNDLLWNSQDECLDITKLIINNDSDYKEYQSISLNRVKKFSKQEFDKVVWEMFK